MGQLFKLLGQQQLFAQFLELLLLERDPLA
jgi:hypothetical protein